MGTLAQVKRGDYGHPLIVDLNYRDSYLNLTDTITVATPVVFIMTPLGSTTPIINRAPAAVTDVDPDGGTVTVTYTWQPGDTDIAGTYRAEVEFGLTGGAATAPTQGYLTVRIGDDLG